MRASPSPVPRVNWEGVALAYGVWTLLALLSIAAPAFTMHGRGQPIPWTSLVPNSFIEWYVDGLASVVLVWTVHRYPVGAARIGKLLPVYGVAMIAAIAVKLAISLPLLRAVGSSAAMPRTNVAVQEVAAGVVVFSVLAMVLNVLELQRRLKHREQIALELRAQLSEAELELLKGQLQPHFLFNTLNGVASLIHTAPAAADLVVVQLADLLRASLDYSGEREIPLSAELSLVDKYVRIMDARFEGKLTVHRDIEPATLAALVPQFILQPLVENAFEHGIARRGGAGQISIRVDRDGTDRLRLEVSDDGAGLDAAAATDAGIGLGNMRRRLERLYGDAQSLTLSARPQGGTVASVHIPFRTA